MFARWGLAVLTPFLIYPLAGQTADDVFSKAIRRLGGTPVSVARYPHTVDGLTSYLKAIGVRTLDARALTEPNHPDVARRLGYSSFLPKKEWWPRGAALALLTEKLQTAASEPVRVRNWWRPPAYNADPLVGGASNGDHPTANAVDLDYQTDAGRKRAERLLRSLDRRMPELRLSMGLGGRTTHVGIGSPRGRREWHYSGWVPAD